MPYVTGGVLAKMRLPGFKRKNEDFVRLVREAIPDKRTKIIPRASGRVADARAAQEPRPHRRYQGRGILPGAFELYQDGYENLYHLYGGVNQYYQDCAADPNLPEGEGVWRRQVVRVQAVHPEGQAQGAARRLIERCFLIIRNLVLASISPRGDTRASVAVSSPPLDDHSLVKFALPLACLGLASRPNSPHVLPAQAMSGRQRMLAAVRRAFAPAAPLDPSSAPRLAPRALGELVRPGALFPSASSSSRVDPRPAGGGRRRRLVQGPVRDGASEQGGNHAIRRAAPRGDLRRRRRRRRGRPRKGRGGSGLHLRALRYLVAALAAAEALWASSQASAPAAEEQTVSNWSGTQHVNCARHVQPESVDALAKAASGAHHRRRSAPWAALSPTAPRSTPRA